MVKRGFMHRFLWIALSVLLLLLDACISYAENPIIHDEIMSSEEEQLQVDSSLNNSSHSAYLDVGFILNQKLKSLVAGVPVDYWETDTLIKAIRMTDALPESFEPSEINTVSIESSPYPVYAFFDNVDNNGIIYIYTEGIRIVANPSMNQAFLHMSSLTDISGLSGWDVSQVEDMTGTFYGATSLKKISALQNWDTGNVLSFHGTFSNSGIIDATPLANWNTSKAINMSSMFSRANSLRKVDVSHWNTENVTDMAGMFAVGNNYSGDGVLSNIIGLGNLNVSNVTDMTCMFYGAGCMTHYDISGWDVSNVQSFNHMFCDNFNLKSLDLSAWNVSNVRTMYNMFDDNFALSTIGDVSHWDTSSLIDVGGWLNGARSFIGDNGTLDLSGWNTENLKVAGEMFREVKLHTIDLSGWTFSSITNKSWPGAGNGIYYTYGNESYSGLGGMFLIAVNLSTVYVSPAGYESYTEAVSRGVSISDMWTGAPADAFTVSDTRQ